MLKLYSLSRFLQESLELSRKTSGLGTLSLIRICCRGGCSEQGGVSESYLGSSKCSPASYYLSCMKWFWNVPKLPSSSIQAYVKSCSYSELNPQFPPGGFCVLALDIGTHEYPSIHGWLECSQGWWTWLFLWNLCFLWKNQAHAPQSKNGASTAAVLTYHLQPNVGG